MDSTHSVQPESVSTLKPDTRSGERDWAPTRVDLLGLLARVAVQWRIVFAVTAVFLVLSTLSALLLKPYYEAEATFLPPVRDTNPLNPIGSSLSPNSILAASGLGLTPGAAYLGLLRSRSVQDNVAHQLNVQEVFHLKNVEEARAFVARKAVFDVQTNGIVSVICRDGNPEFAAHLANAYLQALYKLNQRMSFASLQQRGEFYSQEVAQARGLLEKAEANLIGTQQRVGILEPASSAQVAISTEARLQSLIQAAEVQLTVLLQSQTENSPEVTRVRSQITQLRSQLLQQQSAVSGTHAGRGQAGGTLPQLTIESVRSVRAVREREAIYEALLRQSDVTRFSETDPGPQLQVIDEAVVPLRKAGPSRRLVVSVGTLGGVFLSLFYVSLQPFIKRGYSRFRDHLRLLQQHA